MECPECQSAVRGRFCGTCGAHVAAGDGWPVEVATMEEQGGHCACGADATRLDGHGFCQNCGSRWLASPEDHQEIILGAHFASVSDRGLRHVDNQDAQALAVCEVQGEPAYVAVVCDGVSSSSAGAAAAQVAAQAAQQALVHELTRQVRPIAALVLATQVAQRAVLAVPWSPQAMPYGREDQPPHTTLVMTVVYRGTVYYAWIGDSRLYWFTPSDAGCPVVDHSWINAEMARGTPRATVLAEAKRLRLSRALVRSLGIEEGVPEMVVPEVGELALLPGDIVLLCSDGLHIYGDTPEEMACAVRTFAGADAPTLARRLVAFAYSRGAVDNVTACVFQYVASH